MTNICHASCCSGDGPEHEESNAQYALDQLGYPAGSLGECHAEALAGIARLVREKYPVDLTADTRLRARVTGIVRAVQERRS